MSIQNLQVRNTDFDVEEKIRPLSNIHIRLQQRGTKKSLTLVEGLAEDLDLKKIAKCMRKKFQTSGAILTTEDGLCILRFSGDQRVNCKEFMIEYKIWEAPDPEIIVHGA